MKPSKNKVKSNFLFYGFCIYLIILLYIKKDTTHMTLFVICVVTVICSLIHILASKYLIEISTLDDKEITASRDNKVEVMVRIHNKMWVQTPYIYMFMNPTAHLESMDGSGVCVAIPPRTYKDIKFTYSTKYSGSEMIALDNIIIQDYIGIIKVKVKVNYQKVINVLPEIVNVKTIGRITKSVAQRNVDELQSRSSGLGEPSYELAPYKEGDSMKLVHWKLLARRDVWMVRERETVLTNYRKFTIIIDPIYVQKGERAKVIDKTVNMVITMASHILDRGDEMAVVYNTLNEWETIEVASKTDLTKLADILSRYNGIGNGVESRWPGGYLEKIEKINTGKIFITPKLDFTDIGELEKDNSLEVITIIPSNILEDSSIEGWYLSQGYEVNRYV